MSKRPDRLPNYVLGSVLAHALLAGAGVFVASKQTPLSLESRPRQTVEMEFTAPERQPEPQPTPAAQPEPTPVAPTPVAPQPNARVIRDPQPSQPTNGSVEPNSNNTGTGTTGDPNGSQNPTPTTGPTQPNNGGIMGPARVLTTNDLLNPSAGVMMNAARLGNVAMPAGPTAAQRAEARSAAMFGPSRRCTGTPEECARIVASGPITDALAQGARPNPPGTGRYARQVSTRLVEEFQPVRQIPNVASIVSRGVLVTPTATRTPTAGENAHNSEMAARTGIDMGSGTVTIPQAPYRMVRAEIEVDQDAQGAITGTRVATSSRSQEFDRAAERAIRDALTGADRWETAARRRSRWSIEVSEAVAAGRIDTILRAGGSDPNLGWRVAPDSANGMRIRYRVRMVSMVVLREDPPAAGAQPGSLGRPG
jgi:hypothetical protein